MYITITSFSLSNIVFQEDCDQHIINSPDDAKKKKEKYDVEFKIILLGATGSGKSSAGNVLLQKHGNNEGFETSCYAKSQTKQSVLKSVIKTVTSKNVCKRYKIDIIDTPAISNTELTDEDAIDQLKEAKRMSHPGPHAFLFCVPVNTITNHFTNVIESKDLPFDGRLFDSTIVVFTRCDQFKSQNDSKLNCKDVMKQNHILKKMKYHITLSNKLSQDKKSKKLDDVIGIIIKIDNENKKSWYSRFLSFFYTKHQRSK